MKPDPAYAHLWTDGDADGPAEWPGGEHDDCNPICGHHISARCRGCNVCRECDGCCCD